MLAPLARPVVLSTSAQISSAHRPKPPNLPLTNSAKASDE
jgi:hypothetical protein